MFIHKDIIDLLPRKLHYPEIMFETGFLSLT